MNHVRGGDGDGGGDIIIIPKKEKKDKLFKLWNLS